MQNNTCSYPPKMEVGGISTFEAKGLQLNFQRVNPKAGLEEPLSAYPDGITWENIIPPFWELQSRLLNIFVFVLLG